MICIFVLSSKLSFLGRPFVKRFAYAIRPLSVGRSCLRCWCIVAKWLDGSRWNLALPRLIGTQLSLPERGAALSPNFSPCIVSRQLHGSRWHLVQGRSRPRPHCVTWGPSSPS